MVAEDGGRYHAWSVVDLNDNEDVADWRVVASPDGRVHVFYDAQRNVLALQSLARYACIEPAAADDVWLWRVIAGRRVRSVAGTDMPVAPGQPRVGPGAALGFNPATHELLLVRPHDGGRVRRGGAWCPVALLPQELVWDPRVAPRTAGSFDVAVIGSHPESPSGQEFPVFYLRFRDGGGSAPVEVDGARVGSFFSSVWDAVQIAGDGDDRVFVTWPMRGGIEGRWVYVRGD